MNLLRTATSKIKTLIVIAALALLAGVISGLAYAQTPDVVFNNGQGVEGVGDEKDFLRINNANGGNVAEVCEDGAEVKLWFYVHNTNPTILNGENYDGIGVAKNTVVDIDLDDQYSKNHVVDATVTADNAALSEDGASINCGDREIQLEFVSQQLSQDPNAPAGVNYTLEGSILNNAKLGFNNGTDNVLPGCFEYRAYIIVTVKIKVKEEPKLVPAICDLLKVAVLENKRIRVEEVRYTANDATVNNVNINYGDGTNETINFNQIPREHTYTTAGDKTIVATLNTTFEGRNKTETSAKCKVTVPVKEETQPKYDCVPDELVMNGRKATFRFKPVASDGAVFKDATVKFYADGSVKHEEVTNKVNTDGKVVSTFTYDENAKNLEAEATVRFNIGSGKDQYTKEVKCSGKAVLGTSIEKCPIPGKEHLPKDSSDCKEDVPPTTTIPDTGAGSVVGLLAAVAAVGAVAHRTFTLKRQ